MAGGTFNVEVVDKISPAIARRLEEIARNAGVSADAVDRLKGQINATSSAPVDNLSRAARGASDSILRQKREVDNLTKALRELDPAAKRAFSGFNSNQRLNIGYQLQDIIVSLQGGQKPLTVFLQQGGQIGQVFAQSGATASQGLAGIARILTSFINPITLVVAGFAALALSVVSFISFSSGIDDVSKRLGVSKTNAEALYKSLYKITGLSLEEQKGELSSIGSRLNTAANNPDDELNRRFKANGLSIVDATGKLKSFEDNMKSVVALIQNAKSEFDAIDIGKQVGGSEELSAALFRSKTGLGEINAASKEALDPLKESAAAFDKNFSELWRNFVLYAKSAIQEVGAFLFGLLNSIPGDIIGTFTTKAIGALKAAPGAIIKSITNANTDSDAANGSPLIQTRSRKTSVQNFGDRFDDSFTQNSIGTGIKKPLLPTGKKTDNSAAAVAKPDKAKGGKTAADVEEDINTKLDQQIARLKLLKPEREIQQQLDEAANKLKAKGKTLSDEEIAGLRVKITEVERLKDVQQAMDSIYDQTVGTQTKYNATLEAANNLLKMGVINQDQYGDAVNKAKIKVLESTNSIGSGLESGLLKTVENYGQTSSLVSTTVTKSFDGLADGLADFASGSKTSFSDLTKSILSDVTKMILRVSVLKPILASITGGSNSLSSLFSFGGGAAANNPLAGAQGPSLPTGGLGGFLSSLGLPGFATGGSFAVGGNGGTDSQLVAFRASPNERVKVSTPGQSNGDGVNIQVMNYSGAPARVEKSPNNSGGNSYKVIVEQIKGEVARDISSGQGAIAGSMQQRYGLDPARGAR